MADDESKRKQAVRDLVNSGKLLNGVGRYSAVMAVERRTDDESRVQPLTDFTTDPKPDPLLTRRTTSGRNS